MKKIFMTTIFSWLPLGIQQFILAGKAIRWTYLLLALPIALFGPYQFQSLFIIATVFTGVSIFITRTGNVTENGLYEKRRVALVMLIFIAINACVTLLNSSDSRPHQFDDPGFWITNRFLYLFGLAFFMSPLIEPFLEDAKTKGKNMDTVTIFSAVSLIFFAFVLYYLDRSEPCHSATTWYTSGMLADDCLMSLGVGILLSLFAVSAREKKEV